ncbi:MAG: cytochrome b [Caulobacteraceae bacterium]
MKQSRDRFSVPAICLHWAIAGLLLYNIWLGWQYDDLKGLAQFKILQLHKSVGITVLVLTLLRFAWRLVNKPPELPEHMPRWEKFAAEATHWAFYAIMLGLPITGWIMVSASPTNLPTFLYQNLGLHLTWPHLGFIHDMTMPVRKSAEGASSTVHHLLVKFTYALFVLHVAAALKHHFVNRDDVLWRMLPFWPKPVPKET